MKKISVIFLKREVAKTSFQKKKMGKQPWKKYNSFYCKINDTSFAPGSDKVFGSPQLFGGYSNNFSIVRITAKCTTVHPHKYVIIELNNFRGVGEYLLSDINNDCRYEEFYPDNVYKSALTVNGKVTITKDDRVNFILSGTFEFSAGNSTNLSDIVSISKGYFDLKF